MLLLFWFHIISYSEQVMIIYTTAQNQCSLQENYKMCHLNSLIKTVNKESFMWLEHRLLVFYRHLVPVYLSKYIQCHILRNAWFLIYRYKTANHKAKQRKYGCYSSRLHFNFSEVIDKTLWTWRFEVPVWCQATNPSWLNHLYSDVTTKLRFYQTSL